jgi:predicted ribosome quality control (RQC) complex YloA/Tae2 family protein
VLLSLCELRRVARIVDGALRGRVVDRWVQPDANRLGIALYGRDADGSADKRYLLLSAAEGVARASETQAQLPAAPEPPALVAYLRAHLGRARLARAGILGDDRQLVLRFEAREGDFELLLSLLGRRSNVYLLDAEGKLVSSLRPLRETRDELAMGDAYTSPSRSVAEEGEDRFADVPDADYLRALEEHYGERETEGEFARAARELQKGLRKELKNAEKRLARVEAELAEADQTNELQRHGDILKTALGQISAGDESVTVRDYETDADVVIPLDPKLSPKQNLDAIFKRYKKLLRRLTKAGGQLDTARAWRDEIAGLKERCEGLVAAGGEQAAAELDEIASRPEIARLLSRARPAGQKKSQAQLEKERKAALPAPLRDVPGKFLPRRFLTQDGLEVWVGRSDAANDYLSTRLARGKDLFFHVDGSPGSHVVLRTEGRPDPPPDSVLDACELAVRFSKMKNASNADLHVVPIKNVSKPKGAKPGLVYVTGGRSIHLRRDDARLERILKSRIED